MRFQRYPSALIPRAIPSTSLAADAGASEFTTDDQDLAILIHTGGGLMYEAAVGRSNRTSGKHAV